MPKKTIFFISLIKMFISTKRKFLHFKRIMIVLIAIKKKLEKYLYFCHFYLNLNNSRFKYQIMTSFIIPFFQANFLW